MPYTLIITIEITASNGDFKSKPKLAFINNEYGGGGALLMKSQTQMQEQLMKTHTRHKTTTPPAAATSLPAALCKYLLGNKRARPATPSQVPRQQL